ncbi:MAG: serpin family protein [Candidatus Zixiibacteriota bacterium]|nr:MAG: serpin family protein [candidate division Zixibacteria bacterium]
MCKSSIFFVVMLVGVLIMFCSKNSIYAEEDSPRELNAVESKLVKADNKFGFNIFKEIVNEDKDSNVFISPLSISMALAMTYNGADGNTKQAMASTLELSDLSITGMNESYQSMIELLMNLDPQVIFQIANSIWYRQEYDVEHDFVDLNRTHFNAEIRALDFNKPNSVNIINNWVDKNTNGKIKEIVQPPIDPQTVMYLINAIYFKGTWTYEFDKKDTRDDKFNLVNGSQVPCKMMVQEKRFRYFENDEFQAIDLPYGDKKFSMIIFLPKPKVDVNTLISMLDSEDFDIWLGRFSKRSGTLYLPKFKIEYGLSLNRALSALGMGIAFTDKADFTKINKRGGLFISEVKHKTFIEVNEEGTEAAAVTSVGMMKTSVGPTPFVMRLDRPFILMIRENHSRAILFMGKIMEPTLG